MPTPTSKRLLLLLLAAVVALFTWHSATSRPAPPYEKQAATIQEPAGTQLLWESLSRQFMRLNAY